MATNSISKATEAHNQMELKLKVLEKQKQVLGNHLRSLMTDENHREKELEKKQEEVWREIDEFVSHVNAEVEKYESVHWDNRPEGRNCNKEERERMKERMRLEGEMEALALYKEAQERRIKELKNLAGITEDVRNERCLGNVDDSLRDWFDFN